MQFTEAVRTCFSKYADFTGRAARSEYWWFALFNLLVTIAANVLDAALMIGGSVGLFSILTALGLLLPGLAVGARRLHDIDRTGWWLLIALVPLVGVIVLIVFFIMRGSDGQNRFGADPLAGAG